MENVCVVSAGTLLGSVLFPLVLNFYFLYLKQFNVTAQENEKLSELARFRHNVES